MSKIIYTGGTFDLFHSGHVNFLATCCKISEQQGYQGQVTVSLNTDKFITEFKGKPPICSYEERKKVLLACRYVYNVVENTGGKDSKPAILRVNPDFIVVGDDWRKKDYYAQMDFTQQWLDQQHITLIYVPYSEGINSTEIKRRLSE